DATLNNLCYQYKYDGRSRLVEKKLPGKGWEYMVYDKQDRLVLTQDAILRAQGRWLYTKYDQFGRVLLTGLSDGSTRLTEQSNTDAKGSNNENRASDYWTNSGMSVYYTNGFGYPNGNIYKVLSINYYDTYPTGTPIIPTQVLGQEVLSQDAQNSSVSTKSLPVASYVKNIEDDNWTKNYTWYDKKGRAIGTYSFNHLGGYTKTESLLDFAGVTTIAKTYHKRLDTDTEKVITENFEYDHQNRLLVHKHKVDNNTEEILAQNTYNELSQLSNKKVGGIVASNPLQSIDYTYNIRGWMTKINDPANLNGKLFGYKIKYSEVEGLETPNTDFSTLKVKPKYNG
ncbi:MAG TPA: sugar-binding protein, partial [Chryseobacterium sp.]|nr:sugar-binding protein [Chryseobacterium sp.]